MTRFTVIKYADLIKVSLIASINGCLLNIPESHLMPTFYKHKEHFECKVHWSFKEIGQKYQSYWFKNIYSKSAQWIYIKQIQQDEM